MRPKLVNLDAIPVVIGGAGEALQFVRIMDQQHTLVMAPSQVRPIIDAALQGGTVHFVTGGRWSLHELLTECLAVIGPASLHLSTFSITELSARVLATHLHEGRLTELHMLLDYRAKVRYPQVYQLASNIATRIRLTPVHAKLMVLQAGGVQLTLGGSANWTDNKRIEWGMITACPETAAFTLEWLEKAMNNGNPFE